MAVTLAQISSAIQPYGRKLRSMREEYVYLTVITLDTGCYFGADK